MDNAGDIVWEYMKEILLQVLGMAPVQLEFPVPDWLLGTMVMVGKLLSPS